MFNNLINILTAPNDAFKSIKEKPRALFPLLLLAVVTASLQYAYFEIVDRDFLIDQLVEQAQGFVNAPEAQIREGIENRGTGSMGIQSVISIFIGLPLILSLYAGYLSLVTKFTYDETTFKEWFTLVCWCSIPGIFGALAGWVILLSSSNGMIALEQLKPLSLNNLIFQTRGSFQGLLSNIDLTNIWGLVLLILGYKHWTGKSMLKSILVISAPYIVILGIVLAFILT